MRLCINFLPTHSIKVQHQKSHKNNREEDVSWSCQLTLY
jgi:hypothetical protein